MRKAVPACVEWSRERLLSMGRCLKEEQSAGFARHRIVAASSFEETLSPKAGVRFDPVVDGSDADLDNDWTDDEVCSYVNCVGSTHLDVI